MEALAELGFVREITGRGRERIFAYMDRKGKPRSESSYWPTKGSQNISLRYLQYVHPEYPNTDIFKEPLPALFKEMVFCVP